MFLGPLLINPEWVYLQNVWERWQSLNVGVLAFVSSVLLYKATKYNAEQTRLRHFNAAKAVLPAVLVELSVYIKDSVNSLDKLWEARIFDDIASHEGFEVTHPELPFESLKALKECISLADQNVGNYLSRVISNLQVIDMRLATMCRMCKGKQHITPTPESIEVMLIVAAKSYSLVSNLFEYSRNRSEFPSDNLTIEDYEKAYMGLNVDVSQAFSKYNDLIGKTCKAVESPSEVFSL